MIKQWLLVCAFTGTAFGQSVVTAPAGNQTITQPDGTTFAPSSLGFMLFAGKCPGTDIGMKINSCAAKLPLRGGYHVGTIILPNSSSDTADATGATTVHIGPGVNAAGAVTVPVCNTTTSPITPNITPAFNVPLIP